MKRGQVTIFIIIAIAILVIVIITFIVLKNSSRLSLIPNDMDSIKNYIIECSESSAQESLELIGMQGGYYNKPEDYIDFYWTFIPYFYLEGKELNPSVEKVEEELSESINKHFSECMNDVKFKDHKITFSNPKSEAILEKDKVTLTIDSTVKIEKENKIEEIDLNKVPIEITTQLSEMIVLSAFITESHKEYNGNICISCISRKAEESNFTVKIHDIANLTELVVLITENEQDKPHLFEFINKYSENYNG